jgi:hypothetical protein
MTTKTEATATAKATANATATASAGPSTAPFAQDDRLGVGLVENRRRQRQIQESFPSTASGGEPGEAVGEEALLEDWVKVRDAVVEDFSGA